MIKLSENHQLLDNLWPMIDGTIIGAFGGIVNDLRQKTPKDWRQVTITIVTAGFAGMLAQLLSGWLGADPRLQFALSGIAGYGGGVLLDDVFKHVRDAINKGGDALVESVSGHGKKSSSSSHSDCENTERADH